MPENVMVAQAGAFVDLGDLVHRSAADDQADAATSVAFVHDHDPDRLAVVARLFAETATGERLGSG
ncbi:MAG: hypothetical protein ACRDNS_23465, partial [Trebonia sp.]